MTTPVAIRIEDASPEAYARSLRFRSYFMWLDGETLHPDGQYSFIASDPSEVLRVPHGEQNALSALDDITFSPTESRWSFVPRWIGMIAYDALTAQSPPQHLVRDPALPSLVFAKYSAVIVFDHQRGETWIVGENKRACEAFRTLSMDTKETPPGQISFSQIQAEDDQHHLLAIKEALLAIERGDLYEVNLARRWHGHYEGDLFSLWLAMRKASPVPFGAYVKLDTHTVLSRSMERFLFWEGPGKKLISQPIKGTVATRFDGASGKALLDSTQLSKDPKEHAEHVMLVDLVRNDVGQIANPGTVRVAELMKTVPFAGLSHMVSTIECTTRDDLSLSMLFAALFPPASVTGTPKHAVLRFIEAHEQSARGIYTGAIGFIDHSGRASFSVAIRTALASHENGTIVYYAGGGIVADSIAEKELRETVLKARVFLDAIEACEMRH